LAVTLFSIAMTISMMIILQFSQPFHGPHAVSLQPIQQVVAGADQPGDTKLPGPGPAQSDMTRGKTTVTPR
jgi:hypothetical protein